MPSATARDLSRLDGLTALVTGGGTGIGRATAELLAKVGANVIIHFHSSRGDAEQAQQVIRERGGKVTIEQADLVDATQAKDLVDRAAGHFGGIDILINNAGSIIERAKIEDCSLEVWNQAISVNLTSAFLVTQRAIPHLRKSGSGSLSPPPPGNDSSSSRPRGGELSGLPVASARITIGACRPFEPCTVMTLTRFSGPPASRFSSPSPASNQRMKPCRLGVLAAE